MIRVVYISYMPLTSKIERDWFIVSLLKGGLGVKYLDVSKLLRGSVIEPSEITAKYCTKVGSYKELSEFISQYKKAIFFVLVPQNFKYRKIFKILNLYQCKKMRICWGAMPSSNTFSLIDILCIPFLSPKSILSKLKIRLFNFIEKYYFYNNQFDLTFYSGYAELPSNLISKKNIPIGLCDHSQYILSFNSSPKVAHTYILFLDVNLPFHSDFDLLGLSRVEPISYFNELNNFFRLIEKKYNTDVIVAAHPKACYSNEYCGRRIISGDTATLARDALFIITHASTAVSYATLYKKPLLLIYTDEMYALYKNNYLRQIRAIADYLKRPFINISGLSQIDDNIFPAVNTRIYEKYIADFIATPDVTHVESSKVFLDGVLKLEGTE